MPNVNEFLDIAKDKINKLASPGMFLSINSIDCEKYKWNRISRSDGLVLCILFLNYVKSTYIGVVSIERIS